MFAGGRALTIGFLAALAPIAAFAGDPAPAAAGAGETCVTTRVYDIHRAHELARDGPTTASAQALAALAARHRLIGFLAAFCTVRGAPAAAGTGGLMEKG